MKRKKLFLLLLPVLALVMELLPWSAVCHFACGPGESFRRTYSYFSLIPFGYVLFPPLITGILTCVLILLCLYFVWQGRGIGGVRTVSAAAFLISVGPLLYGLRYYSWLGAGITCLLGLEALLAWKLTKES